MLRLNKILEAHFFSRRKQLVRKQVLCENFHTQIHKLILGSSDAEINA